MTFHERPFDRAANRDEADTFANSLSVLAEVSFKWLMAGHGWQIDTARFYSDPEYAAGFIERARTSNSATLRECADRVEAEMQLCSKGTNAAAASGPNQR